MDGINIDIEQAVEEGSPEYYALTSLVKETTEMFHREIPGSQVKRNDWALGDNGHFPRPVSQFESILNPASPVFTGSAYFSISLQTHHPL